MGNSWVQLSKTSEINIQLMCHISPMIIAKINGRSALLNPVNEIKPIKRAIPTTLGEKGMDAHFFLEFKNAYDIAGRLHC